MDRTGIRKNKDFCWFKYFCFPSGNPATYSTLACPIICQVRSQWCNLFQTTKITFVIFLHVKLCVFDLLWRCMINRSAFSQKIKINLTSDFYGILPSKSIVRSIFSLWNRPCRQGGWLCSSFNSRDDDQEDLTHIIYVCWQNILYVGCCMYLI